MMTVFNQPCNEVVQAMTAWRQHLHAHPELGFEEHQTARFISQHLSDWGLDVYQNIGKTGVIGVLKRGAGKRSIGLRADIDALPIEELNDIGYRSKNQGVMHACGHDGHTAMLLGAANYLADNGGFDGTVVFIFQPNEENGEGAQAMIAEGLFERFQMEEVYGLHNLPGMPVGSFATRVGTICASESLFEIQINARGGHAAMPHKGVDAIHVGAQVVNALQGIVSRKIDPAQSAVVSVTEFITNGRRNVLPGKVLLKSDVRAMNPETRQLIEDSMRRTLLGMATVYDITIDFSFDHVFIETINAPAATKHAIDAACVVSSQVDPNARAKTFSEDFAHLAAQRPGCFMLMGNGSDDHHGQPLHAPDYDYNDEALVYSMRYWCALVRQQLGKSASQSS